MRSLRVLLCLALALLGPLAWAEEDLRPVDPTRVLVLGPDGRPLGGAHLLRVQKQLGGTWLFSPDDPFVAQTDEQGRADALPPRGDQQGPLVAWAPGLAAVTLPPGPYGATVRLMTAETTSGRVRLARGEPAAGLEVIVVPMGGLVDLGHRALTDNKGGFTFAGLTAGRWRLLLRHAHGRLRSLGLVDAGAELGERRPRRDTGLIGRLLDADGAHDKPVAGVKLRFEPLTVAAGEAPAGPIEVETDTEGRFRVDGLDPGVHGVVLMDPAWEFDAHPPHVEAEASRERELPTWFAHRRTAVIGTVADADGHPLAGARVHLVPDPARTPPPGGYEPLARPAHTDATGRFRLAPVTPAEGYRLVASLAGYSPWVSNPFRVDRGRDTRLKPVRMRAGWSLRVRVRDGRGGPVAGARIRVTAASRPSAPEDPAWTDVVREGRTGADGEVELHDLPGDDALCRVSAEGWLTRSETVLYPRVSNHRRLDLDLDPAVEMTGEVQVLDGGPTGPFRVWARTRDGRETHEVVTEADGRFRFTSLRDTATDFDVRSPRDQERVRLAEAPNVVPGVERHLVIVVPTLHAVRGTVSDLDLDASGVTVVAETLRYDRATERYVWRVVRSVLVRGGGRAISFSIDGLAPGAYTVRAVQGANDGEAVAVLVTNDDVEGLELLMPAGARIAGTVLDAEDLPVLGAVVTLARLHGDDPAPIHVGPLVRHTDERGEYVFGDVAPGLWRVSARGREAAEDVEVVRVLDGEVRVVRDLLLAAGGTIEGRVEDPAGRPLDGVHVRVRRFDADEGERLARTDGEGTFRMPNLRPGAYHVRIRADTVAGGPEAEALVEVAAEGSTRVDFTAEAESALEGTVLRQGSPVSGALVDLVHEPYATSQPLRRFRAITDAAGRFVVEGLPAGGYRVQLQSGAWRTERTVELVPGDRLHLDLEAFEARVRGTVLTLAGDPVPGAHVLAQPLGEDGRPRVDGAFLGEGRTDPRGTFVLRGLPVGAYAIVVSAPGLPMGRLERVDADLPGADYDVEVVLGRGGDLRVHARDENERGVTGARIWIEDESGTALHQHAFVTGAGGRLLIEGLPPGEARVRVHARGMGRPALQRIVIQEGSETPLAIDLRPAGTLRLIVRGDAGDPLGRARVDLVRPGTGEVLARRRPLSPIRLAAPWGHVPRTGIVDLPDLEEGSYVARISAGRGYAPAEIPVAVSAGAISEVSVTLAPAGGDR